MADTKDNVYSELSEILYRRKRILEKSISDNEFYDSAGQSFQKEILKMPDNTHNSVDEDH